METMRSRQGWAIGVIALVATMLVQVMTGRGLAIGAPVALGIGIGIAAMSVRVRAVWGRIRSTLSPGRGREERRPIRCAVASSALPILPHDSKGPSQGESTEGIGPGPHGLAPILTFASEEAGHFHHSYIGTEHLLLALFREGTTAANMRRTSGVNLPRLRQAIEYWVGRGETSGGGTIAFTPRARSAIDLAEKMARDTNRQGVLAEHLLLALVLQRDGTAAKALARSGLDLDKFQAVIVRGLRRGREGVP